MDLPQGKSAFLWGARKTGKSSYLHQHFEQAIFYDLLDTDLALQLNNKPSILRNEVLALSAEQLSQPIVIDEIQKAPALLDEIHWLIENTAAYFIFCSSSAKKLRHGTANLLGGRAWSFHFYPLVFPEVENLDLLRVFSHGLLPAHYLSEHPKRELRAYVVDYLNQEIQAEGLTRNLRAFSQFLDTIAFCHGELINYSKIASDVAVDAKTVKEYFQILVDTLIGYTIYPFRKKAKRDIISATPKFYLFDVGLANFIAKRKINILKGSEAGHAFEHYIFTELVAYRGINEQDYPIEYWRTKTGLEVDFILNHGEVAIEVKISSDIKNTDIKGLIAFTEEHSPKKSIVVCQIERPQVLVIKDNITIHLYPWRDFLTKLWQHEIIHL